MSDIREVNYQTVRRKKNRWDFFKMVCIPVSTPFIMKTISYLYWYTPLYTQNLSINTNSPADRYVWFVFFSKPLQRFCFNFAPHFFPPIYTPLPRFPLYPVLSSLNNQSDSTNRFIHACPLVTSPFSLFFVPFVNPFL